VQGKDGNFYGTTANGGNSTDCGVSGCGTVFRVAPSGDLTTLFNFNTATGIHPYAGLVQGNDGNFYGTTSQRGSAFSSVDSNNPYGYGTIFQITPTGEFTVLVRFTGKNGAFPGYYGLIQANDGNFYGTTIYGGNTYDSTDPKSITYGNGTVFRMAPNGGVLTILVNYGSTTGLVQANDGDIYGLLRVGV
jgi:uncharacterized repeat protein (TIGR03803 family)